MALIANNINSNQGLIRPVDLSNPDRQEIANVLGEALRQNYMESSVEWVTSHPHLDEPHFNLAAQGICGNTALLDFGDMSYLKLLLSERKMYNFREFLRNIGRDNNDSFIFGHGICLRGTRLRELVLNTSFLSATSNEAPERKNGSRLTYTKPKLMTCFTETLNLSDLICTVQGTYFLCDGSRTNASVLEVRAKGLRSSNAPFAGLCSSNAPSTESKRFINSMQEALQGRFGSQQFVALGGVYIVNNARWEHNLNINDWERVRLAKKKGAARVVCEVNTPETMITTFNSSTQILPINGPPIVRSNINKLHSSQSIHSLYHHSSSVNDSRILDPKNIEYVGYFCPATKVYRIDEPPQ